MLVTLDPGITEVDIRQGSVLSVGDIQTHIPGTTEHVGVLHLTLAEHTLALAVAKAAGELSRGLLNNAEHNGHVTGLLRDGFQSHLDVAEQLGAVKTLDIALQLVAVEGITGLNRDLPGHHPFLCFANDGLTVLVLVLTFLVEELHLHTRNTALGQLQGDNTIGTDPLRTGDASQGIALTGKKTLQSLHPQLQVIEIEGAAVIRAERVFDHRLRQQV